MRLGIRTYFFIILTFVYLVVQIGLPVFKHYCGGELESISFLVKENGCCGEEEEESDESGCCQNELQIAQQNATSILVETCTLPLLSFFLQGFTLPSFSVSVLPLSSLHFYSNWLPPPKLLQQQLVQTRVMRI